MLFYPIFHAIFFILQNKKKIDLSTFVTKICLFSSFTFRLSLVNYFLAFSLLLFKRLFYYNSFIILNDTIKVTARLRYIMVISQSRCPTFNLNYMLIEYLQIFSDKINKCKSRIFINVRILLLKNFLMSTLVFINCNLDLLIKTF